MKGIITFLELLITAAILILSFLHFFPQYSIRTNWASVLLDLTLMDTLNTIDAIGKTYEYATSAGQDSSFEKFMEKLYSPQYTERAYIWWKEVSGLPGGYSTPIPYYRESKKESLIDVVEIGGNYYVYSFTIGLGYPY